MDVNSFTFICTVPSLAFIFCVSYDNDKILAEITKYNKQILIFTSIEYDSIYFLSETYG